MVVTLKKVIHSILINRKENQNETVYSFIRRTCTYFLPVHAQKTYVGVKGGVNFADLEIAFEDEPSSDHNVQSRTLFGAVFGAGLSVPVWKGSLFIEGRYALGMTNMNKGGMIELTVGDFVIPGPETDPGDEIKSLGIQIMAGYQLPLGGK